MDSTDQENFAILNVRDVRARLDIVIVSLQPARARELQSSIDYLTTCIATDSIATNHSQCI